MDLNERVNVEYALSQSSDFVTISRVEYARLQRLAKKWESRRKKKKVLKSIWELIHFPFFHNEFFVENLVTMTAMVIFFAVSLATIFGLVSLWFFLYSL